MNSPRAVYRILLGHYGSQGWWPTTSTGKVHPVYHSFPKVAGLSDKEQFEICVGAILTQNTAWTNVEKALTNLHRTRSLTPEKIAGMPFSRLAQIIRSSGYFRQKAKKLKLFAQYIVDKYDGKVSAMLAQPVRGLREELLSLHGVGPETADSILLYAGAHPVFVVDAYTRRIGRRLGLFETEVYDEVQDYFESRLDQSAPLYNEFHALLVALGKNLCRTRPLCAECLLNRKCPTGKGVLQ